MDQDLLFPIPSQNSIYSHSKYFFKLDRPSFQYIAFDGVGQLPGPPAGQIISQFLFLSLFKTPKVPAF